MREFWSSYQKLALMQGQVIVVNNVGYQAMVAQPPLPATGPIPIDRWTMPYALRRPAGRVLIVGAGSGNDAAAALQGGASAVTAVEIDRIIYQIGRALHPQAPYRDPRVHAVIDDARHYLKTSDEPFDLIVFSHLDSHTLLSSFTNVRLDNYIYTVEAFREARARLAPRGILYVSFFSELPFIGQRLSRNLSEAFGHPPVAIEGVKGGESGRGWRHIYFLTGEPETIEQLGAAVAAWNGFARVSYDDSRIVASTDDWPFLHLESPRVPPIMSIISLVILALSAAFVLRARPAGEAFDGRLFWLGAAFMLLEVHNVSRLALVFGTTWQVNAWVIGVILGLILLSNAVCHGLQRRGRRPGGAAVMGLFVTLAAAYLVPLDALVSRSQAMGGLAATVLLSAPIFFAGLVFAQAFTESAAPAFALGWNVLGAVTGGMAENLSYVWGVPALVPLAACLYVAALLWPRRTVAMA
jgi:SAM-dependent methyltransferase